MQYIKHDEIDSAKITLGKSFSFNSNVSQGKMITGKSLKYDGHDFIVAYKFSEPTRVRMTPSKYDSELLHVYGEPFVNLIGIIGESQAYKNDADMKSLPIELSAIKINKKHGLSKKLREKLQITDDNVQFDFTVTKLFVRVKSLSLGDNSNKLGLEYLSSDASDGEVAKKVDFDSLLDQL